MAQTSEASQGAAPISAGESPVHQAKNLHQFYNERLATRPIPPTFYPPRGYVQDAHHFAMRGPTFRSNPYPGNPFPFGEIGSVRRYPRWMPEGESVAASPLPPVHAVHHLIDKYNEMHAPAYHRQQEPIRVPVPERNYIASDGRTPLASGISSFGNLTDKGLPLDATVLNRERMSESDWNYLCSRYDGLE
eukprot:TRINITY_DN17399_c0_g1_i2.p1 TRINITY_DN17399_c0_g1~~TRINITY_DN17399_c0_g1_i2.p1  ORF type:complete len:190 (+),score=8.82 TRINITY_DN17399_c0_g1_i2:214-783(+)